MTEDVVSDLSIEDVDSNLSVHFCLLKALTILQPVRVFTTVDALILLKSSDR